MKTIAEQIKWNFKTNGTLVIRNKNGNCIYYENSYGDWVKRECDSKGKEICREESSGYWVKREYDSKGNIIYYENSSGYWEKSEYDSRGKEIYYENSIGRIRGNQPKSCENKIVEIEGVKYKLVKQ